MRGVVTIARLFGIPVQLHWTFSLVFVWLFYQGWQNGWEMQELLRAGLPLTALFICVVLHEFGHALTARRFGVVTRDIILSPIGGVARMTRLPDKPMQELLVAVAGPLVNLALALVLLIPVLWNGHTRQKLLNLFDQHSSILFLNLNLWEYLALSLLLLNALLALFNLLPAFPMDGGRILRALLSLRMSRKQATRIATYLGKAIAVAFIVYGLWGQQNLLMAFIGVFVFAMGSAEYRTVSLDDWLEKQPVGPLVRKEFSQIHLNDSMEVPADISSKGPEHNFIIVNGSEEVCGILSGKDLMRAVRESAFEKPVSEYYVAINKGLQTDSTLKEGMQMLQDANLGAVPVFEEGKLIGVLDATAVEQAVKNYRL